MDAAAGLGVPSLSLLPVLLVLSDLSSLLRLLQLSLHVLLGQTLALLGISLTDTQRDESGHHSNSQISASYSPSSMHIHTK